MRKDFWFKLNVLVIGLIFTGCASFEPALRSQDLTRPRQPSVREAREGLEISVEEFASARKSSQAFDADIAFYGVLALLIRLENSGTETYRLQKSEIRAFLGEQHLSPLAGEDAANQAATREYAGKALIWTIVAGPFAILLWPVTMGASASHTYSVNRRVQQHFESLELIDTTLKPNQTTVGFLYFNLPVGVQRLEKLTVEVGVSEDRSGKQISHKLSIPTVELSAPVTFRPIPTSNGK